MFSYKMFYRQELLLGDYLLRLSYAEIVRR